MKVEDTGENNVTYEVDLGKEIGKEIADSLFDTKALDLKQIIKQVRAEIKNKVQSTGNSYEIFKFTGSNTPTPAAAMAGVDLPSGAGLNAATLANFTKTYKEYLKLAKEVAGTSLIAQKTPTISGNDFSTSFAVPSDKANAIKKILADYAEQNQSPLPYTTAQGQRFKGSMSVGNTSEHSLLDTKDALTKDLSGALGVTKRVTSKGNAFYSYIAETPQGLDNLTKVIAKDRLVKPEPRTTLALSTPDTTRPYLHSEVGSRVHEIADDNTYYPEYDYYHPNNARAVRQANARLDWNKKTWGGLRERGFITKPLFDGIASFSEKIKTGFSPKDKEEDDKDKSKKVDLSKALSSGFSAASMAGKELIALAKTATTSLAVIIGLLRGIVSFVNKEAQKVITTSTDGMRVGLSYSRTAQANRADVLQGLKEGTTVSAYKTIYSKLTNPAVLDEKAIDAVAATMGLKTEDLVRFATDSNKDISEITGLILNKFIQQTLAGKDSLGQYRGVTRAIGDNADTLASAFGSDIADIFMRIMESTLKDHGLYKLGSFEDYLNSADKDRGLKADAYGNSMIELDKLKAFNEELNKVTQALKNFGQNLAVNLTGFLQPLLVKFEDLLLSFAPADVQYEASVKRIEALRNAGEQYNAAANSGKGLIMNSLLGNTNLSDEDIAFLDTLTPEQLVGVLLSENTASMLGIKDARALKRIRDNEAFKRDRINMTADPLLQHAVGAIDAQQDYARVLAEQEKRFANNKLVSSISFDYATQAKQNALQDKYDSNHKAQIGDYITTFENAGLNASAWNMRNDTGAQAQAYQSAALSYLQENKNGANNILFRMLQLRQGLARTNERTDIDDATKEQSNNQSITTAVNQLMTDEKVRTFIDNKVLDKKRLKSMNDEQKNKARRDYLESLVNSELVDKLYAGTLTTEDLSATGALTAAVRDAYPMIKTKATATFKESVSKVDPRASGALSPERVENARKEHDRDMYASIETFMSGIFEKLTEANAKYGNGSATLEYSENANSNTATANIVLNINGKREVISSQSVQGEITKDRSITLGVNEYGRIVVEQSSLDAMGK